MPEITTLLIADGETFVSRSVASLSLTFDGIAADRHRGATRLADARTPWHARGVRIANTRHLSLVSEEDCAEIAGLLNVDNLDPALLGANVVVRGIPSLSLLAPSTRLQFPSGATIFVTEQNVPCRHPAGQLARAFGRPDLTARFIKVASGRRGLVAMVEREGNILVGDAIGLRTTKAIVTVPPIPTTAPPMHR